MPPTETPPAPLHRGRRGQRDRPDPEPARRANGDAVSQARTSSCQANQAVAIDAAFAATDNVYRYYFHPGAEHLTYAALDDWRKESAYSADLKLQRDPPHVIFSTARFLDAPQYGLIHDHAYWISELRTSGGDTDYGTADLTSAGCGGTVPQLATSSDQGTDPVPWTSDDQHVASTTPLAASPKLTGTLTGVSSLEINTKQTCLDGKDIDYEITSDARATISFSDGRRLIIRPGETATGTLKK